MMPPRPKAYVENEKKTTILLHICCAPDATASFERLHPDYNVVGFFHNPNIHPEQEYKKRLREAQTVAERMGFDLILPPYKPEEWLREVKGLEAEPEKGKRCEACFRFNLRATAQKAAELGIPYFTTTLSISPHKNSEVIFSIAKEAAEEFEVEFLQENFKKKDGFKRSLDLARELDLYRQNYCGCRFSQRDAGTDTENA
jgi:predicted adenine nucleotide alpha hydrolase (AANH) superfamily ATPase